MVTSAIRIKNLRLVTVLNDAQSTFAKSENASNTRKKQGRSKDY